MSDPEALGRQLRAMGLAWRLTLAQAGDRSAGDPLILRLELARAQAEGWRQQLAQQVAGRLATDPATEPLAQQVAQALLGMVEQPGPVDLSAHAALHIGAGAQLGDVRIGDIAGRDLIKVVIHVHAPGELDRSAADPAG